MWNHSAEWTWLVGIYSIEKSVRSLLDINGFFGMRFVCFCCTFSCVLRKGRNYIIACKKNRTLSRIDAQVHFMATGEFLQPHALRRTHWRAVNIHKLKLGLILLQSSCGLVVVSRWLRLALNVHQKSYHIASFTSVIFLERYSVCWTDNKWLNCTG